MAGTIIASTATKFTTAAKGGQLLIIKKLSIKVKNSVCCSLKILPFDTKLESSIIFCSLGVDASTVCLSSVY